MTVRSYILLCCATFLLGFASEAPAQEDDVTMHSVQIVEQSLHRLTWRPPLERENGDPLDESEITGYEVERLNDEGAILETVELDGQTLELAITIVPDQCMIYRAYTIALDGSPDTGNGTPNTLKSKATDSIRICVIPPKKPRDFMIQ